MVNKRTYRMSFTTGGVLKREMFLTARLFQDLQDWKAVQQAVYKDNLFQLNTLSSQRRLWSEVYNRLIELSSQEFDLYLNSSMQQQGYFIWLTLCRRYPFIGEFTLAVITPKHRSLDSKITLLEYNRFWENKLMERPELEKIAPTTQKRLRSELFLFMREIGIINNNMEITPVYIDVNLYKILKAYAPEDLLFFPLAGAEPNNN